MAQDRRRVAKIDREKRNKHRGFVLWLTGLPCAGKTTIALELEKRFFASNIQVNVLDGDNVRCGLNRDLGFSPDDRKENIRRIGEVAKLFSAAGMIVLVAVISPYQRDRDAVRALLKKEEFVEVFVKASLETCKKRDVKALYVKALNGKIGNFTGISAPYEEPVNPEIVIDTDHLSLEESVEQVIKYLVTHGLIGRKVLKDHIIHRLNLARGRDGRLT